MKIAWQKEKNGINILLKMGLLRPKNSKDERWGSWDYLKKIRI